MEEKKIDLEEFVLPVEINYLIEEQAKHISMEEAFEEIAHEFPIEESSPKTIHAKVGEDMALVGMTINVEENLQPLINSSYADIIQECNYEREESITAAHI